MKQVIPLGDQPGAGNLVLAEVKLIHISEKVLDEQGKIDQAKMDLVARLGGDWYCRVEQQNLFKVAKPLANMGMGMDALPSSIRQSHILSANNLAQLANVEQMPSAEEVESAKHLPAVKEILDATIGDASTREVHLQSYAKVLLEAGDVATAWKVLLM